MIGPTSWLATVCLCQAFLAQAIDLPGGKGKIEFLGLKRQKAADVLERLSALAPGKPLHACAADLKTKLGFKDASVALYPRDGTGYYAVVTLVEPEDAARVKYRPATSTAEAPFLSSWKDGAAIAADSGVMQAAVLTYCRVQSGKIDEARRKVEENFGMNPKDIEPAWNFLKRHTERGDCELAGCALDRRGDPRMRALAAAVLLNFADVDATWWRLAEWIERQSPK